MDILGNPFKINLLFFIFLQIVSTSAYAQLSPGDLHRTHKDLEGIKNCTSCHERGKQLSADKCLHCHQLLKTEIDQNHGLHSGSAYQNCADCHVEHQGRSADLIYWKDGQDAFDHKITGYVLEGKHKELKCRDCHRSENIRSLAAIKEAGKDPQRTFLGLHRECLSCHHDEHRGQLASTCRDCHDMNAWKPAPVFKHDKTAYPLTGRHQKVDCIKCHKSLSDKPLEKDPDYLQFKPLKHSKCNNCHNDPHKGRLGANCTSCHTTSGWQNINQRQFDHDRTRYPLRGKHLQVACAGCHKNGKATNKLRFAACTDCHAPYHNEQFSKENGRKPCSDCHTVAGFSPSSFTIEQHQSTKFALTGAHLAIPCIACHDKTTAQGRVRFRFNDLGCTGCHSNPHGKSILPMINKPGNNSCQFCHNDASWQAVRFDHSQTKFVLSGRHKKIACVKCHLPTARDKVLFNTDKKVCADCHADPHGGQFIQKNTTQTACQRCHTPQDWLAEKFDHNRDSRFSLKGAHRLVDCKKCHIPQREQGRQIIRYKPLDTACSSCHGNAANLKLK